MVLRLLFRRALGAAVDHRGHAAAVLLHVLLAIRMVAGHIGVAAATAFADFLRTGQRSVSNIFRIFSKPKQNRAHLVLQGYVVRADLSGVELSAGGAAADGIGRLRDAGRSDDSADDMASIANDDRCLGGGRRLRRTGPEYHRARIRAVAQLPLHRGASARRRRLAILPIRNIGHLAHCAELCACAVFGWLICVLCVWEAESEWGMSMSESVDDVDVWVGWESGKAGKRDAVC